MKAAQKEPGRSAPLNLSLYDQVKAVRDEREEILQSIEERRSAKNGIRYDASDEEFVEATRDAYDCVLGMIERDPTSLRVKTLESDLQRALDLARGTAMVDQRPWDQEDVEFLFPEEEGWRNDGDGWYRKTPE